MKSAYKHTREVEDIMAKFKLWLCCFSSQEQEPTPIPGNSSQDLSLILQPACPLPSVPQPTLTLEVIESPIIPRNSQIDITSKGLEFGRRGVKDGCAYFGSALMRTKSPGNDYVWPSPEEGLGGQHFAIRFDKAIQHFLLRDMGEGNGTFLRVQNWRVVTSKSVISFENSHTLVEILGENRLQVAFLEGPLASSSFIFSPKDRCVFIGRMTDCRIHIPESQSRYAITFKHTAEGWVVGDGDGNKGSVCGVWIFVDCGVRLVDQGEFKAGQTRFRVRVREE